MVRALPPPRRTLFAAGVAALAIVTATPVPATAHHPRVPHIVGTGTVPVYSYAAAIRESVWVETPTDSDSDGVLDRVAVDIIRPREAADRRIRVPVIIDASPYYQCCGRGNESERKQYAEDGTVTKFPLYYDNYFVPRGYAFAAVDLTGTSRSTGCEDVGGPAEVAGAKAVIDWLNGRAKGYTADGSPARATWTTGTAGMIGKSWDGTIANAVAATGVRGLATIVPISAISSWYDYSRAHGVLRSRQHPAFLHNFVTGRPAEVCAAALAGLRADSAEDTGNYNDYWRTRDYLADARHVRASVLVAHGLNDLNVRTQHFGQWWEALARRGVPRKMWLYQAGHEDPFDVRRAEWVQTLHRWFDRWLHHLRNGIDREPRLTLETAPGTWTDERDWPARGARSVRLSLGAGDGTTGTLGGRRAPWGTTRSYTDESLREVNAVADPSTAKAGRLAFLTNPLGAPLRISGEPSVRLRIRVDRLTAQLTARLVDYGTATRVDHFTSDGVRSLTTESCWGQASATDDACYLDTAENLRTTDTFVLTRGWLDAAHHASLRTATPLLPDRWYTVTIPLHAYDALVPAGHVLGLVLGQSDPGFTVSTDTNATVEVDLALSSLTLPAAGRVDLGSPSTPPTVTTRPELRRFEPGPTDLLEIPS